MFIFPKIPIIMSLFKINYEKFIYLFATITIAIGTKTPMYHKELKMKEKHFVQLCVFMAVFILN